MKRYFAIAVAATAWLLGPLAGSPSTAAILLPPAPGGAAAVESAQLTRQVDSAQSSYAGAPGTESYATPPEGTPVDTSISFP